MDQKILTSSPTASHPAKRGGAKTFGPAAVLILLLLIVLPASAHTLVSVGKYTLEVGWVDEPPVVGQRNALVVNVSSSDGSVKPQDIAVTGLKVTVAYGGESKALTLQPLGEDTPGQYIAPLLPTRPGKYTVQLGGKLGDTDVNASVQPEEVLEASSLEFPSAPQASSGGLDANGWLGIGGMVLGLAGAILGLAALARKK